ncbi:MAG: glycerophosphodiester phosphodiesterase family protein [Balneolaceae bacterium]
MRLLPLLLLFFITCSQEGIYHKTYDFDLQGHRGARGLLPENTIPGFLKAVDLGVDTIEFDVVVTKDHKLLISHEPWFNHKISTKPDGNPVTESEAMDLNIYEMTYEETKQYDVGKRGNAEFPRQQPMEVTKPLMIDAILAIEKHIEENSYDPVYYNIETKSRPEHYDIMVPPPDEFARLVYEELSGLNILNRVIIQSFDVNTLIAMREIDPDVTLALLVDNRDSLEENLDKLGFIPEIYSPYFKLLNSNIVRSAQEKGMKVIPWTINNVSEMILQLEMGVDGIITDYPDIALPLKNADS